MAQDPEVRACLNGLVDSVERLYAVVNEIITVSRIASGQLDVRTGPVALRNVARSVVASYEQVIRQRSLSVTIASEGWPATLMADEALLELAFSNVLGNAIKYTPDGGSITLAADTRDRVVRVTIRDTGIGIDPADQIHIFERFFTAGDTQLHSTSKAAFRGGGLGLGLAISKGIIEAHGGHIWVESDCCDLTALPGSTFFIELPLGQPPPEGTSVPGSHPHA